MIIYLFKMCKENGVQKWFTLILSYVYIYLGVDNGVYIYVWFTQTLEKDYKGKPNMYVRSQIYFTYR